MATCVPAFPAEMWPGHAHVMDRQPVKSLQSTGTSCLVITIGTSQSVVKRKAVLK